MSWIEETKVEFVQKGAQIGIRTYFYEFREKWWHRFVPWRASFSRPFDTIETAVNGDLFGHMAVLANPDFEINNRNVMEWARSCISKGRARLCFTVTYELMSGRESLMLLDAQFSDRKMGMLFKLTFG